MRRTELTSRGGMDLAALMNAAATQAAAGNLQQAVVMLQTVVKAAPDAWQAHYNLAKALAGLGRTADAILAYKRAVKLHPDDERIRRNLANLYKSTGQAREAEAEYRRALSCAPNSGPAHFGLALVLCEQGRLRPAEAAFRRTLELMPDHAEAHFALALLLLRRGFYAEGWDHYEWRWKKPAFSSPQRDFGVPQWDGTPLDGRTIVLHSEQGFGDAIQFLRFVAPVAAMGAKVVLDVQSGLLRLLRGYPGITHLVERFAPLPCPVDCHLPLMSLPKYLGITLDNLPAPDRYIHAPADMADQWKERLKGFERPRIGLIWAGNPVVSVDKQRSPGLRPLLPLLSLKADFFALQMGEGRQCLDGWPAPDNFHDMGEHITDMADTAAIMDNLDLVVSSCTAPAHLAAALGVPSFVLLAKEADWRWLDDRDDSPWYPSVHLFRQRKDGDWGGVVQRVGLALQQKLICC